MAEDKDLLVIWQTAEHATCSRHRSYALSCKQFDALLERAEGRCELCGLEGYLSAWGQLHIDHEHQVGRWAVRGLLCDGCNSRLQRGRRLPQTAPLRRYLGNSWYRQELAQHGVSDEMPPEPGVGSSISAAGYSWTRIPGERAGHWARRRGVHSDLKSWPQLWYDYGPLSLRITEVRDSFPKWEIPFYKSAINIARYLDKREAARPDTGQPAAALAND